MTTLPKKQTTADIPQIIKHNPTDPEYLKTAVGDTKIPDPIIVPTIILLAEIKPNSRFSSTTFSFLTVFRFSVRMKNGILQINVRILDVTYLVVRPS